MTEYEMMVACLKFIEATAARPDFDKYMSVYYNLNDEELQDEINCITLNNEVESEKEVNTTCVCIVGHMIDECYKLGCRARRTTTTSP